MFEIKDLAKIEKKKIVLDFDGDDGIGPNWDFYYKNPTWEEVDIVCGLLGIGIKGRHDQDDHVEVILQ